MLLPDGMPMKKYQAQQVQLIGRSPPDVNADARA